MIFRSKGNKDSAKPGQGDAGIEARNPAAQAKQQAGGAEVKPGQPVMATSAPPSEEAQRRTAIAIRQSVAFAQTVTLLMHSPHYKHYTLADLEWLVLPPLLTGQFSVAEAKAKENAMPVPVAVALWASVSPEVDQRLSQNLGQAMRLRPDEWRSGDILWLFDAVGDARVVPAMLKQLAEGVFKGRDVKVRTRGEDGKVAVRLLPKDGQTT